MSNMANRLTQPEKAIKRPGFGLPLSHMPKQDARFPVIVGSHDSWEVSPWRAITLLIRESCMLKVVEDITNKPEWWLKVYDPEIIKKWKNEFLTMRWEDYRNWADFTPAMADGCIKELQLKAGLYQKTGLIPVMDYSACAIKSDKLIPDDLRAALIAAVARLENVPDDRKDWHPGSNGLVLDLVHPSLWPLIYGRSRIVSDTLITRENCLECCGMGDVLPHPNPSESKSPGIPGNTFSQSFQWLPCDVIVDQDGHAKIDSYINNLHPVEHADMYSIIEKFITISLPAWDIVYRWPQEYEHQRLKTMSTEMACTTPELCADSCEKYNRIRDEGEDSEDEGFDSEMEEERERRDEEWFIETHKPLSAEPTEKTEFLPIGPDDVRTSSFFYDSDDKENRIQVIVKLANIHLTPEKPDYNGGSWHIEGQLNEHIVSTALFYYDCENITDCHLNFRTPANREDLMMGLSYAQSDLISIERLFSIDPNEDTIQDIGGVLTRQGRALFFPNLYQHQVGRFSLKDKTRPGHRKILALFLVDPTIPIISTANVPPQQKHWWTESVSHHEGIKIANKLPPEIVSMIHQHVDFPIEEKEAKEIRGEVMAERTVLSYRTDINLGSNWNFCEH
ncbi:hypothetical protein PT974_02838 [Cladobotryum mycophilum]|uniref:Uncharacterized protein n=1 Tax=Cladobotryum mycophilum TaxID=491253 RepID=A0ABR0SZF6_9HYPO